MWLEFVTIVKLFCAIVQTVQKMTRKESSGKGSVFERFTRDFHPLVGSTNLFIPFFFFDFEASFISSFIFTL